MKLRSSGVFKLVECGVVSSIKDGGTPRAFEKFCNLSTQANI